MPSPYHRCDKIQFNVIRAFYRLPAKGLYLLDRRQTARVDKMSRNRQGIKKTRWMAEHKNSARNIQNNYYYLLLLRSISIVKPTVCTISQIYFILEQHSTCFGRSLRSSLGVLRLYIQHQVYSISYRFCGFWLANKQNKLLKKY
jgi:hypothetical protein